MPANFDFNIKNHSLVVNLDTNINNHPCTEQGNSKQELL